MRLEKYESLGNDFLLLFDVDRSQSVDGELARRVCDRRRGVGADGLVLLVPVDEPDADLAMTLWNSDGSRAETSGNGLRCVARAAVDLGVVNGPGVAIRTEAGIRRATVEDDAVAVEMGEATINVVPDGPGRRAVLVDVGNPHLVIDDDGLLELAVLGTKYPQWNVELVSAEGGEVTMAVWERGAGETLACGSGSCASAAAAHAWGLVGERVVVHNPGGDVEVALGHPIVLRGPARRVATVELPCR
jgi:diaminopimelate epimerase